MTNRQIFETVLRWTAESKGMGELADDLDGVAVKSAAAQAAQKGLMGQLAVAALPVTLVTAAVTGLGYALAKLTKDAQRATEDLRARGLLSEEDARKIDKAAKAIDGVSVAFSSLKATVAGWASGFTDNVFTGIVGVITGVSLVLQQGAVSWDEWAEAVGRATGKVRQVRSEVYVETPEQSREWEERKAKEARDAARAGEEARLAFEAAEAARYLAAQTLASGQLSANTRMGGVQLGNQGADQQAAIDALDAIQQHKIALHQADLARIEELKQAEMAASMAAQEHAQRLAAQHAQYAAIAKSAWTTAAVGIVSALGSSLAKSEAGQKRAALSSIAANTGAAIMQAAASAPPPYNALPIAAMAFLGAVQFTAAAAGKLASPGAAGGGGGGGGGFGGSSNSAPPTVYQPSEQSGERRRSGDQLEVVQISNEFAVVRDLNGWLERNRRRMRLPGG